MFPPNTSVIINCDWSSFHGLEGIVVGEDARRRPLPSVLVFLPTADVADHEKEVYFHPLELLRVDTPAQM